MSFRDEDGVLQKVDEWMHGRKAMKSVLSSLGTGEVSVLPSRSGDSEWKMKVYGVSDDRWVKGCPLATLRDIYISFFG